MRIVLTIALASTLAACAAPAEPLTAEQRMNLLMMSNLLMRNAPPPAAPPTVIHCLGCR